MFSFMAQSALCWWGGGWCLSSDCRAIIVALYVILTGALAVKLGGAFDPAPGPIQIEHGALTGALTM
jgi:hypothetical protein